MGGAAAEGVEKGEDLAAAAGARVPETRGWRLRPAEGRNKERRRLEGFPAWPLESPGRILSVVCEATGI